MTRIASRSLDVPFSAFNLVGEHRVWTKSACGFERMEMIRGECLCAKVLLEADPFLVPNLREDERCSREAFSSIDSPLGFYMAHPIISPDNQPVGTLCVLDTEPRNPSEDETKILEDLASILESELQREHLSDVRVRLRDELQQAERKSRIDALTELWNRRGILQLLREEVQRINREGGSLGVAMVDIDDFKTINDQYGHPVGDEVLREVTSQMQQVMRDYDVLGRFGGEEFLVLFPKSDQEEAISIAKRIREQVETKSVKTDSHSIDITISLGVSVLTPPPNASYSELIRTADQALYCAKEDGKNTVDVKTEWAQPNDGG